MKRLTVLYLLAPFILTSLFFGQAPLTDSQVIAAIERGLSGKGHEIGLTLNDKQTNFLSIVACETCHTTGYTIFVYTPESWIELKAVQARREMLPFGVRDVTPEMRLPYIHVLASPSRPEYLNANGMAMASSVHRVVLSNTDKSVVIQPLSESHAEVESNSALRSFTQASAGAVFSMQDVERLRYNDLKHEFFIVVVGDNKNKYFKVKSRFFSQLFGRDWDGAYAGVKTVRANAGGIGEDFPENTSTQTIQAQAVNRTEATSHVRGTTPAQDGQHQRRSQKLSQDSGPDKTLGSVQDKTPTKADVAEVITKSGTSRNNTMAAGQSDAYQHDSALIATWWNLREPDLNSEPQFAQSRSANVSATSPGFAKTEGSIGAWSDEKPRIRHDGIRIDRMTPNGPADQAGLEVGDEILAIDGIYIFTLEELTDSVNRQKNGTKVPLRYRRRSIIYDTFVIMGAEESEPLKSRN